MASTYIWATNVYVSMQMSFTYCICIHVLSNSLNTIRCLCVCTFCYWISSIGFPQNPTECLLRQSIVFIPQNSNVIFGKVVNEHVFFLSLISFANGINPNPEFDNYWTNVFPLLFNSLLHVLWYIYICCYHKLA